MLASIGTILCNALFRWALDIKFGILPLKDDLLGFWIPFTLPWIPIFVWLRRRVRILRIRGKNDNGYFGYQVAMAIAIAVPNIISQDYLSKSSFKLIELNDIRDIEALPNEKYFKIDSFELDTSSIERYTTSRFSGRYNEDLKFYLFIAIPFKESANIWYGVEYGIRVSNRTSEEKKNSEYRRFINESEEKFESLNLNSVTYFEQLHHSDERDGFIEAIRRSSRSKDKQRLTILNPKSKSFDQRTGSTASLFFGSFGIGALIILIMVAIPKINQTELSNLKKRNPLKSDVLEESLEFLELAKANKGTAILVALNIIVFAVMTISGINIVSPTPQELLEFGGNRRAEVLSGEYWRLFTYIFVHGGISHLFMNLLGLLLSAAFLEDIIGKTRLLITFVACGILASIYWHANTVSVGSSGSIFGFVGLIAAFTIFKIYPDHLRKTTWSIVGVYAGTSILFGFLGGIDNAAHFGGLVAGFCIGVILIPTARRKSR